VRAKRLHFWVLWRGALQRCARPGCPVMRRRHGSRWIYRVRTEGSWMSERLDRPECKGKTTRNR